MSDNDPFRWLDAELDRLDASGLQRTLRVREGKQQAGKLSTEGNTLINFGSNDYLGLAGHPALAQAASQALADYGMGSGASPLITGRGVLHARLEQALADFKHSEAALLSPSGYAANTGSIAALMGPGDTIYSDTRNHASIIDGCRLSRADVKIFAHADAANLEHYLSACTIRPGRHLIVTDSLFSMDGDFAPLELYAEFAQHYNAMLMVDEAHATGVFGSEGTGLCEQVGIEAAPGLIRVGTLSKALGCMGGFVTGPHNLIQWLVNRARPYFFSTAPPEAISAAALEALHLVQREPQRRVELLSMAAELRERLVDQGFSIGSSQSQIVPVILGEPERTMRVSQQLREQSLLVPGIRPPSVPPGESMLRISLCRGHKRRHLDELVDALVKAT